MLHLLALHQKKRAEELKVVALTTFMTPDDDPYTEEDREAQWILSGHSR